MLLLPGSKRAGMIIVCHQLPPRGSSDTRSARVRHIGGKCTFCPDARRPTPDAGRRTANGGRRTANGGRRTANGGAAKRRGGGAAVGARAGTGGVAEQVSGTVLDPGRSQHR
jgi:hypothetical protein